MQKGNLEQVDHSNKKEKLNCMINQRSKMIELLAEVIENQNHNNVVMIKATKELKKGMTE